MEDPLVAFAGPPVPHAALEIRVNFGIVAGREATAAEIDALARSLLVHVPSVSIVAEQRYEVATGHEATVHQVRIEVAEADLPPEGERDATTRRLVEEAGRWAEERAAERRAQV